MKSEEQEKDWVKVLYEVILKILTGVLPSRKESA